jgi:hypothetical protein
MFAPLLSVSHGNLDARRINRSELVDLQFIPKRAALRPFPYSATTAADGIGSLGYVAFRATPFRELPTGRKSSLNTQNSECLSFITWITSLLQ